MSVWKWKFALFALVVFAASTGPAYGNILSNGDFENGADAGAFLRLNAGDTSLTGWTILPDQIDLIGTFYPAASGGRSVDLDGTFGFNGGLSQTFATTPGATYNLSFSMAGNVAGDPVIKTMTVQAAGATMDFTFDITGHSASDLGWETRTWSFMATDVTTTLDFISTTTPAGIGPMIDNVVLVNANPGVEVLDLPPGPITELVQGEPDPRFPRVRVGVPEDNPPAKFFRRTDGPGKAGKRVGAGECYNTYWDGRPFVASGFLCPPPYEIDIWQISVSLYFPEAGDITLVPKFIDSTIDADDCAVPATDVCVGSPATFSIPAPGTYTLSMAIDCGCATMDAVYFITVCVVDKTTTTGPFMTTGASGGHECFSYVDLGTGDGWEDVWIKYPSLPGPFQVSGNAACCETPVKTESRSWGEVKSDFGQDQP